MSNWHLNHSAVTCLKPADHISVQDLISTLFGNHAQCMFNFCLACTYFLHLLLLILLTCYFNLKVCNGTCTS